MDDLEKFECMDCGCYYWVENRNEFDCPNCEDNYNTIQKGVIRK